ncbi:hypothetical protein PCANC_10985 [Puccinia coronata f. sp. avenae]|uniref:Uncharacterized protein n=1 Tax=Puccinia coronata f. sp. avenae TaxID=200324 RepID=A0A2N5UWI0_9BASI|nr:hypothetical protein PCANC_10985 [Puccinia coronata f. sp. avenae]
MPLPPLVYKPSASASPSSPAVPTGLSDHRASPRGPSNLSSGLSRGASSSRPPRAPPTHHISRASWPLEPPGPNPPAPSTPVNHLSPQTSCPLTLHCHRPRPMPQDLQGTGPTITLLIEALHALNANCPISFFTALQEKELRAVIAIRKFRMACPRIILLTYKTVHPQEPETNPYQLPTGTQYFLRGQSSAAQDAESSEIDCFTFSFSSQLVKSSTQSHDGRSPKAALGSSELPSRTEPSGLALSLKTYPRSPLGPTPPSKHAPEFKPSESARPAFLASLPLASSSAPHKQPPSFQPLLKPRLRHVPKARSASRSSSQAPSIASSASLNPTIKALLKSGSPLSKGTMTVSINLIDSMEKNPFSTTLCLASGSGEGKTASQQAGLAQLIKPRTESTGTMSSVIELAKRRLSFLSGISGPHSHHMRESTVYYLKQDAEPVSDRPEFTKLSANMNASDSSPSVVASILHTDQLDWAHCQFGLVDQLIEQHVRPSLLFKDLPTFPQNPRLFIPGSSGLAAAHAIGIAHMKHHQARKSGDLIQLQSPARESGCTGLSLPDWKYGLGDILGALGFLLAAVAERLIKVLLWLRANNLASLNQLLAPSGLRSCTAIRTDSPPTPRTGIVFFRRPKTVWLPERLCLVKSRANGPLWHHYVSIFARCNKRPLRPAPRSAIGLRTPIRLSMYSTIRYRTTRIECPISQAPRLVEPGPGVMAGGSHIHLKYEVRLIISINNQDFGSEYANWVGNFTDLTRHNNAARRILEDRIGGEMRSVWTRASGTLAWSLRPHSVKGDFKTHGEGNTIWSYTPTGWKPARLSTGQHLEWDHRERDVIHLPTHLRPGPPLRLELRLSFGSFQIVNLLFDEWLGFKIALHVAAVAASVDTTSSATQLQSMGSESLMYLTEASSQSSHFQGFAAPANNELASLVMTNAAMDNSDVAHPGTYNFLFLPNTSQAFAIAQTQAQGHNGCIDSPDASMDQTVMFNSLSGASNSLYNTNNQSLGGAPPGRVEVYRTSLCARFHPLFPQRGSQQSGGWW